MAFYKHRSALLEASNGKDVPIETTPQEVLSLMGVEAPSHLLLAFLLRTFLLKELLILDLYK